MCFISSINNIGECQTASGASSGGNIVYANDQMTKCISRNLADEGVTHPWYAKWKCSHLLGETFYIQTVTLWY
jgi:hypothetical protein